MVLIYGLFFLNYQAEKAVLMSIVALIVATTIFGFDGKRPGWRQLFGALSETGHGSLDLILITGAAGIVIGALSVSGLGYQLTLGLVSIGNGHLFLLLILSAIVCIILGMGLPTVGVYVLLATLVAPSMIQVGVKPMAAHFYVMYFGMMSMITPPVALAAFAAATVAGADPMRTGFAATRFGWTAFIVPILFVYSPTLLLIGAPLAIVIAVTTATFGVWLMSSASVGYFMRPLSWLMRLTFAATGLAALIPAGVMPGGYLLDVVGVVGGIAAIAFEYRTVHRQRALVAANPQGTSAA